MGLSLGAYLLHPITEKFSSDEENSKISYGVSSMQGWRETQEDAHNCILDYDGDTSLFAVYDGHGGNEVSEYTSQHLPDFIKKNEYYKIGDFEKALKDSFVKFDSLLKEPEVIKVLQKLAKYNECNDDEDSESEDNLGSLKAEALMSIEEVMAKYAKNHKEKKSSNSETVESSETAKVGDEFSEVSSNGMECSSRKLNASCNESDSEVSSSSSCAVTRKSLSEKYSSKEKLGNSILDSTSKVIEESNSNVSSEVHRFNIPLNSESSIANVNKTELETNECSSPKDTKDSVKTLDDKKINCNGRNTDINNKIEETISSSVKNDNTEESKSKGKGKALMRFQHKPKENNSEKLFQKFIHSESNEEMSESDSDDATFNGPEGGSDDDDEEGDENSENDGEDSMVENEELDEEEPEDDNDNDVDDGDDDDDDDDDIDDDVDDEEDEENSEEYEYENEMDRCFIEPGSESGCTALVALIKDKKLYVANAGDCRCVVSKNGEAIEMSFDHKPENEIELKRIEKAGGRVSAGRVNDGLNLSRALGDHVYKRTPDLPPEEQMISPLPDIQILNLEPDIEFMVLACDGIWNSMSSKEVIDFVRPRLLERTSNLSKICEELFDHCLAPNTLCDGTGCDNMTAIIVQFKDSKLLTSMPASKKRSLDKSWEAEECTKKQKTENVTSSDSIESKGSSTAESHPEKSSDSPDTTQ